MHMLDGVGGGVRDTAGEGEDEDKEGEEEGGEEEGGEGEEEEEGVRCATQRSSAPAVNSSLFIRPFTFSTPRSQPARVYFTLA